MQLEQLLALLAENNIKVGLDGEQLKIRAAKGALTPEIKQALGANKAQLLIWLQQQAQQQEQLSPIPKRADLQAPCALSFAQQRLHFIHQLEPNSASYNIPAAVKIRGQLNLSALQQALNTIIARHDSLRTQFVDSGGETTQQILPELAFELVVEDYQNRGQSQIEQAIASVAGKIFDLATAPLLAAKLMQTGSDEYILVFCLHHIITDGWSTGVLLQELTALYQAYQQGQANPLAPLAIQYPDFSLWQRDKLSGDQLQQQIQYWQQQLSGLEPIELATDYARPAIKGQAGNSIKYALNAQLSQRLSDYAKQRGVTLFSVLMAGFKTLLHRYSQSSDICVGTPVANRNRVELEPLIGFFVNTLALRTKVEGEQSFAQQVQAEHDNLLAASHYQDAPFEQVIEALKLERNPSHTPVFQHLLVLQNSPAQSTDIAGLSFEQLEADTQTSKFDLSFNCLEVTGQDGQPAYLDLSIEYDTALFKAVRIEAMAKHFEQLLEHAMCNDQLALAQLNLLEDSEKQQLLDWGQIKTSYPRQASLAELYQQSVANYPDNIAWVQGEQRLSYKELDQRVNQLANELRQRGVQAGDKVALCFSRGLNCLLSILAIVKNHAAYVPLDPDYPDERLSFMLSDTQAKLILSSQGDYAQRLSALEQLPPLLLLDQLELDGQATSFDIAVAPSSPEQQLAYIMYTSGSTGKPKGVMVPHRGIVRLVRNSNYIELDDTDALAFISNVSFDAATFEIWGALLNGGRLVGVDKNTLLSPSEFKRVLIDEKISAMFITVTLFNQYISEDIHFFDTVKNVSVGGEALDINKIRQVLASAKQANAPLQLFNGYGPTENTTFTCSWHINALDEQQSSVPLGYPLANSTAYVLDEQQQLVPAGVAGELYSGGDGVALGYLNRDDLTAEKFIADPFSTEPDAKMYRTGDLVRWLDNGQIEMLGRADDQVKIRGYRIELGEIEAALGRLPGVDKCAVLVNLQEQSQAQEPASGSQSARQYLAAYLVLKDAKPEALALIREQMAANLPQYMQPQAYVLLEQLPLTANGKLDKRALPKPQASDFVQQTYVAPSSETEKRLAELWQDMLDLEQIGVEDNFFELGGHSLMATRLLSQIKQVFDTELPLKELFEQPTIAHLAKLLDGEQSQSITIPALDISAYPHGFELSYAQQRLWIIDQLQPGSPMYNIPLALRLSGPLDKTQLQQALNQLAQRHASLRTRFVQIDDGQGNLEAYQQIDACAELELPTFQLADDAELLKQRIGAFMMAEFDLQNGPLLRAQLIELEDKSNEALLLICQHHIISDGWSLQLLVQELLALYQGQTLAPLKLQYHDFAVWQKDYLAQGVMAQELAYWQQKLQHTEILALPTDTPRPHLPSAQGQLYSFSLDAQLSQQLQHFSQAQGASLYMTLLAAWQLLLARYSNQDDICIGSPVANRTQAQTEGMLGFFVNTLVMRSQINYQHSFSELLSQVKQTCLEAYGHQNVPFEYLVDNLQTSRELSQTPLFQAMFMLQNLASEQQAQQIQLGELSVSALESDSSDNHSPCAAKFDLSLALTETSDGLLGSLEYRSPLFSPERMESLIADFEFLLRQLLAQPQQALGQLNAQRPEQAQQLQQWGQNPQAFEPVCLAASIEQQVARSPQAIACIDGKGQLSYQELNSRANRLAHYLRQQGVAPNTNVGICLSASNQALTAILAVIKAGGAYVPMDTSYPAERLIHMANNAEMQLVICDQQQSQLLSGHALLDINDESLWENLDSGNPEAVNQPQDRLYMIFTSGSTGLPKAAAVSHANEANLLQWYNREHGFSATDKALIVSALGFDLTQKNLFALLTLGGSVVFSQAAHYDPVSISQQIHAEQISVINCAPSAFYPLVEDAANWPKLNSLRCVLFGGEPIALTQLKPWLEQSQAKLVNMYGPTECTDIASSYICQPQDLEQKQLPIGGPSANVELHVLAPDYTSPVPIGAAGELCIAGAGVGLGYYNNPELNQQAFIDNPFGSGRLYRTGDLVRYNQRGQLEFISRIDGQVKIRGFRIELAEIEAQLQNQVGVKDAVVAAKTTANGQQLLAAFVILEDGQELNSQQYRQQLKQLLPDYMVPSAFVAIEAIPLTPNGKVDRKKLELPANADFGQREYVEPTTTTEQSLALLWQEILQLERVGANDEFFEAGGHSLLATKLVSRAKHQFNIELSLSNIFEYPVLSDLSAYIDTLLWAQSSQEDEAAEDDEDREEFEF